MKVSTHVGPTSSPLMPASLQPTDIAAVPSNANSQKSVVEAALEVQLPGVSMAPQSAFPDAVNERLQTAEATAKAKTALASPEVTRNVVRLLGVAMSASTRRKSVVWLHKASDAALAAYGPHSACSAGCSHCCHIPVPISATEAAYIGRAIGRPPLPLAAHAPVEIADYASPCPFLVDNKCGIYAHRPAVCRTHMNMDQDELLCRLVSGQAIPVPYFDARIFAAAASMLEPEATNWADLRQWFASPTAKAE